MSIPSQPTTSNNSCDRLNSNQPSQFFTCPSVFHGDTTHPKVKHAFAHLYFPNSFSDDGLILYTPLIISEPQQVLSLLLCLSVL